MKKHTTTIAAQNALECILGQKTVSFYPIFAKAFGSVPAAVMLSQGLFWQYKAKHGKPAIIDNEEYFAKTVEEWFEETSITESAQKLARGILVKHGVFKEKLAGLPAKMHFRVDIESVVAVINGYLLTGVSVAVKHGNKERQFTRTESGKFRQQETAKDGSIIIESFESFETTTGEGQIDVAIFDSEVNALVIDSIPLKAEKENPTPVPPAPSPQPAPGESAPRRWDMFDIDRAALEFKENHFSAENFARITGTPAAQMVAKFTAEVDVFVLEQKGKKTPYNRFDEFSSHFFNYERAKVRAERNTTHQKPTYGQQPARTQSALPLALQNKIGR